MAIRRLEHVGIVVKDLDAAITFFEHLGMEVEGRMTMQEEWVGRVIGLEDVHTDFAVMVTADGHGRLELIKFHSPNSPSPGENLGSNVLGMRHVTFTVDDLDAELAGLRERGTELVGEVTTYKDIYKLCYVRGPEGLIVELAEEL